MVVKRMKGAKKKKKRNRKRYMQNKYKLKKKGEKIDV
jgi:division protein CdvB (Snf7/Vps24/ESCRT-III family)